ncbi:MAG: Cytochrome bd-II ubiquinol oxidase subunit 1 [Deltaproteobacteria bacterium ADurb.Bin510]|nr:MAG: Cytochrome bd-II ubiquinol oxidase subunit 1 [Deltaproteobacteria bacterium ADurb.Bin510]
MIWLVAIGSTVSAFWILVANAWMQHPVGYVIRGGRAELSDFWAVVSQSYAILTFLHTVMAAYVLGGFFVMGVSAWHLARGQHVDFFKKSFNLALIFTLVFTVLTIVEGHSHGADLYAKQPAKLAALESHWQTSSRAPMHLISIPKLDNSGNAFEALPIPGVLSLLAAHDLDATVVGLNDIPAAERPPVAAVHFSFRVMVALAGVFLLAVLWGLAKRRDIENQTTYLKVLPWLIPLPYLACEAGWLVAEFGRQPWIVYGLLKTDAAASPVLGTQVLVSLVGFIVVYALIGILAFWFMARMARKGPEF